MSLPLSVLDLIPVGSGSTSHQGLLNAFDLARRADAWGFTRYWVAEHHNTAGLASSSPELLIAMIARETQRLRVGAGGIMLPNHSPLKVAEWFRTLEALFPGRIDLGLGRAPGTDQLTALALRRSREALAADDFPQQIAELQAYCGEGDYLAGHPLGRIRATPSDVPLPPLYILSSSGFGARLAAQLGRPFAFAHHFSPAAAAESMRAYRQGFRPSEHLDRPHAILAVSVVCADTAERADFLAGTHDLLWVRIARGETGPIPSPEEAAAYPYSDAELAQVRSSRAMLTVGTPEQVKARLTTLATDLGADELMVTTHVHGHADRVRSYELLAQAFEL